jgi:hypothetical protein
MMNAKVLQMKDECLGLLARNNLICHFVATDGDSGMNSSHDAAFDLYRVPHGSFADIINFLSNNESEDLMNFPLSDLLHRLKGARTQVPFTGCSDGDFFCGR